MMIVNTNSIRLKVNGKDVVWVKMGNEVDETLLDPIILQKLITAKKLVKKGDESEITKKAMKEYGNKMGPTALNKLMPKALNKTVATKAVKKPVAKKGK